MNAVIVEDERGGRIYLETMLTRHCPEVEVVGFADSLESGIDLVRTKQADLLFLDLELPGGSGFDLLDALNDIQIKVIITTAYPAYGATAFRYNAVDYLLKPIEEDDLIEAIKRVENAQKLEEIQLQQKEGETEVHVQKMLVESGREMEVIHMDEVRYFQSNGNYSLIYRTEGRHVLTNKNLKQLEAELDPALFFRVHQSYIVSLAQVSKLYRSSNSEVELANGMRLPVSRRKRSELKSRLDTFYS